jgi:hypothetical protein
MIRALPFDIFEKSRVKTKRLVIPSLPSGKNFFPYDMALNGKQILGFKILDKASCATYGANVNASFTSVQGVDCFLTLKHKSDFVISDSPINPISTVSNPEMIISNVMKITTEECYITAIKDHSNVCMIFEFYYYD